MPMNEQRGTCSSSAQSAYTSSAQKKKGARVHQMHAVYLHHKRMLCACTQDSHSLWYVLSARSARVRYSRSRCGCIASTRNLCMHIKRTGHVRAYQTHSVRACTTSEQSVPLYTDCESVYYIKRTRDVRVRQPHKACAGILSAKKSTLPL